MKMRPIRPVRQEEELLQLGGAGPAAEMVFGDWYPAMRAAIEWFRMNGYAP